MKYYEEWEDVDELKEELKAKNEQVKILEEKLKRSDSYSEYMRECRNRAGFERYEGTVDPDDYLTPDDKEILDQLSELEGDIDLIKWKIDQLEKDPMYQERQDEEKNARAKKEEELADLIQEDSELDEELGGYSQEPNRWWLNDPDWNGGDPR